MFIQETKTLEICDPTFFLVANNQICINSLIKILTSCKDQQYDFNLIKNKVKQKNKVFEFSPGAFTPN